MGRFYKIESKEIVSNAVLKRFWNVLYVRRSKLSFLTKAFIEKCFETSKNF